MIHEDDFKDSNTSPKQWVKSKLVNLIKCNGKKESNKDAMHDLNKVCEDLLTGGKKRDTLTPERSYVYKMKTVEE